MKKFFCSIPALFVDFLDDLLYLVGCGLVVKGVYEVMPVLTWFAAGAMCIIAGILVARWGQE